MKSNRDEAKRALGARLRQWRRERGYSQAQAASVLEERLPSYVHWEHGDRLPGRRTLAAIEAVLDAPRRCECGEATVEGESACQECMDKAAAASVGEREGA